MKSYILAGRVKIDDGDIATAKKWAKRNGFDYGNDTAHLVFDCMTAGEKLGFEIVETEIDEEKQTKK